MKYPQLTKVTKFLQRLMIVLQWLLTIFFAVIGVILLFSGAIQLGLSCVALGIVTLPLLEFPLVFRMSVLTIGAIVL